MTTTTIYPKETKVRCWKVKVTLTYEEESVEDNHTFLLDGYSVFDQMEPYLQAYLEDTDNDICGPPDKFFLACECTVLTKEQIMQEEGARQFYEEEDIDAVITYQRETFTSPREL